MVQSVAVKKKRVVKRLNRTANVYYCKYDVVRRALKSKGMVPVDDVDPHPQSQQSTPGQTNAAKGQSANSPLVWMDTGVVMTTVMSLKPWQKVNHFPGMSEICRKDTLAKNLNRMQRLYPKYFNFYPKTWWLPLNSRDFLEYSQKSSAIFIAKPVASSQGRGIFLFRSPAEPEVANCLKQGINGSQQLSLQQQQQLPTQLIVQKYLANPLLIDGIKFDFRIYVLVTSASPLEAMIYNEGLARFATCKYETPKLGNADNVFMHLTNYSINKQNTEFDRAQDNGSKRTITSVMELLKQDGHDTDKLWKDIKHAIVKTLLVVAPYLARSYESSTSKQRAFESANSSESAQTPAEKSRCFELLGFDVIVNRKLKPFILEVNHSPSLTCDAGIDWDVKLPLLKDTLDVIGVSKMLSEEKNYTKLSKQLSKLRLTSSVNKSDKDSVASESGQKKNEKRPESSSSSKSSSSSTSSDSNSAKSSKCFGGFEMLYPPAEPNAIYETILTAAEKQFSLESHHTKASANRLAQLNAKQQQEQKEQEQLARRQKGVSIAKKTALKKAVEKGTTSSSVSVKSDSSSGGSVSMPNIVYLKSSLLKAQHSRSSFSVSCVNLGSEVDIKRYGQ